MNQLLKFLIIAILFISCKQQVNSKENISNSIEKLSENTEQIQTIQEFLSSLKKDVKEKNTNKILKKVKIPFEFYVAGEIDYTITDVNDLIHESSDFIKIVDSRFIEEIEGVYYIIYDNQETESDPEGGFVISLEAKRDGDTFKVISLGKPN